MALSATTTQPTEATATTTTTTSGDNGGEDEDCELLPVVAASDIIVTNLLPVATKVRLVSATQAIRRKVFHGQEPSLEETAPLGRTQIITGNNQTLVNSEATSTLRAIAREKTSPSLLLPEEKAEEIKIEAGYSGGGGSGTRDQVQSNNNKRMGLANVIRAQNLHHDDDRSQCNRRSKLVNQEEQKRQQPQVGAVVKRYPTISDKFVDYPTNQSLPVKVTNKSSNYQVEILSNNHSAEAMINEVNHLKHTRRRRKLAPIGDHQAESRGESENCARQIECQRIVAAASIGGPQEGRNLGESSQVYRKKTLRNNYSNRCLESGSIKRRHPLVSLSSSSSSSSTTSACLRFQTRDPVIMCWPSWRQFIVLSFLTILMTTLLANLNIIQPSASSCRLFNHCHALSVVQQVSSLQQTPPLPPLPTPSVAGDEPTDGQLPLPVPPSTPLAASPAPIGGQQTGSTSTSTTRPRQAVLGAASGFSNHLQQLATSASSPSASTATLGAPSPLTSGNSSSLLSLEVDNLQPEASNKLGLAPSTAPTSQAQHHQQQKHRFQAKLSHLGPANKSSDPWAEVDNDGQKQQKFSYSSSSSGNNNNIYHTIESSNDDFSEERSNNTSQYPSTRAPSSSINRQQQPAQSYHQGKGRVGETTTTTTSTSTTSRRPASMLDLEREGSVVSSSSSSSGRQRNSQFATSSSNQQQSPVPSSLTSAAQQSSNQAIKVVDAPSFSLTKPSGSSSSPSPYLYNRFPVASNGSSNNNNNNHYEGSRQPSGLNSNRQQQQQPSNDSSNLIPDNWMAGYGNGHLRAGDLSSTLVTYNDNALNSSQQLANEPLAHFGHPLINSAHHYTLDSPFSFISAPSSINSRLNTLAQRTPPPPPAPQPLESAEFRFPAAHQFPAGVRSHQMIGLSNLPQELMQNFIQLNSLLPAHEHIFGSQTGSQQFILRPQSLMSAVANAEPITAQLLAAAAANSGLQGGYGDTQQALKMLGPKQPGPGGKYQTSASASAPSISLPPLSHLLVPRNPFRLFSSSSSPVETRYRPSFLSSITKQSNGSGRNKNTKNQQQQQHQQQTWASASHQNSHQVSPAFQGMANLASIDQEPTRLYAHSHSAEQLEKLVRAASQATGIHTPILPAIVSAPSGTIPGFYIPAIESESESQVNEMRHGESVGSITSQIPGTDYILHPDEVRAMMSIGESAWRKQQSGPTSAQSQVNTVQQQQQQQQQQQNQNQPSSSPSSTVSSSQMSQLFLPYPHPNQHDQLQQLAASMSEMHNNWQSTRLGGFMQENHPQNARDFAYVEPGRTTRRDVNRQQKQNHNNNNNQSNDHLNSSLLESQLNHHFKQNKVNSFPAIIRVNDQDYVHWPLIRMRGGSKPTNHHQQTSSSRIQSTYMDHGHHRHHRPTYGGTQESRQLLTAASFSPFQALYQAVSPPAESYGHSMDHMYGYSSPGDRLRLQNPNRDHSQVPFQSNRLQATTGNNNKQQASTSSLQQESILSVQTSSNGPANSRAKQLNQAASQPNQVASEPPEVTDQSPVRLATQLTPSEIRQVEDSIIETLLVAQQLERQRKVMQQLAASLNSPVRVPRPPVDSSGVRKGGKRRAGSMLKAARFFGRRRRRNSSAAASQKKQQEEQDERKLQLVKQQLLRASSSLQFPTTNLIPSMAPANFSASRHTRYSDGASADSADEDEDEDELGSGYRPSSSALESKLVRSIAVTNQRLPVVMADQETNKPFQSKRAIESRDLQGEATEPIATYVDPKTGESKPNNIIPDRKSPVRLLRDLHSHLSEAVFGSRVARPKVASDLGGKSAEKTASRLGATVHTTSGALDTSPSKLKPMHHISLLGLKPKLNDESDIAASRPAPTRAVADGATPRPHRSRVEVDWPAMVSDADYFPGGQRDSDSHETGLFDSDTSRAHGRQQQPTRLNTAGSRRVSDHSAQDHWPTQPSSSQSLNNYVTSQLKLQFAQDYTAREGVPIYNNNVRVAGALLRSHTIPGSATGSQMGPILGSSSGHSSHRAAETTDDDGPEEADDSDDEQADKPQASEPNQTRLLVTTEAPKVKDPVRRQRPPLRERVPQISDAPRASR